MRFWVRSSSQILAGILLLTVRFAVAQTTPVPKRASAPRANELTLNGLRPGKDSLSTAIAKYKQPSSGKQADASLAWIGPCQTETLFVDADRAGQIQTIRLASTKQGFASDCRADLHSLWRTGRGLRIGDRLPKIERLYGRPDSKSPSSRAGQQLELWYYAFDWAGADVPQVMEILCTKEKDGVAGRVVEITLAAPSL